MAGVFSFYNKHFNILATICPPRDRSMFLSALLWGYKPRLKALFMMYCLS